MKEEKKCCEKCSIQLEDNKPTVPCEHCPCHTPSKVLTDRLDDPALIRKAGEQGAEDQNAMLASAKEMVMCPTIFHSVLFDKALEAGIIDAETHSKAKAGEVVTIKVHGMEIECVMSQFIPATTHRPEHSSLKADLK